MQPPPEPFKFPVKLLCGVVALVAAPATGLRAEPESFDKLTAEYERDIRPLLQRFCLKCHSTEEQDGELDLQRFATLGDVRRDYQPWQRVDEMLDDGEMPPQKNPQPTAQQKKMLRRWARKYLDAESLASAGDPGPVVLRRLNNAEYNDTVRDLTGIESLNPTREFPVDSAAGEGFTNSGAAQAMSPALVTKYFDAAKEIATHAVPLPDGIEFSPHTARRDQTNELLARIQAFYRRFTEDGGRSAVNLQGITFNANQGGRLPLKQYLAATLAEREALASGAKSIETVAGERNLNAKYLGTVWKTLSADKAGDGTLLGGLRARWRATKSNDSSKLAAEIDQAEKKMWKFNSIAHIGRQGDPSRWMEVVGARTAITSRQDFKWKLPEAPNGNDVVFYLATGDAGDGNEADYVVWKNFRLEGDGCPPLPLRDVAGLRQRIDEQRLTMLGHSASYLAAAAAVDVSSDLAKVAAAHQVDAEILKVWPDYLAIGQSSTVKVEGHLTKKVKFTLRAITGWGDNVASSLPSVVANSSDRDVCIPGLAKAHSVVAHPTPTHFAAVGWQSPIDGVVRVESSVVDAHHACGNGFHKDHWWAKGAGQEMQLGKVLEPLNDFREKLLFIRGLYNAEAQQGNIHSSQTGNLLSGAPLAPGGEIRSGTSIDQLLAQTYGRGTKVPSLVLGCEKANPSVYKNYSMLYSSHISWTSPTTPTPLEVYPALAFDRLFKHSAEKGDKSVLDAVLVDARDLRRIISVSDQRKLDEYLNSVREVEQRIERAGQRGELQGWRPTLDKPSVPRPADGIPQTIAEHMKLMCDILVLAFQTDTTRVCTLKLNNDHSSLRFSELGIDYMIHHLLSHQESADWLKVNQFFSQQLAYIARKLDAIQEGERTALDNAMLMYCSSMLTGSHNASQPPAVIVGRGGGKLETGRELNYLGKPNRKLCSRYLSLLEKFDVRLNECGDSTERLTEV